MHTVSKAVSRSTVPLALENGVTSRDNHRVDRARAKVQVSRQQLVAALLESSVKKVTKDSFVFVDVSSMEVVEGEMAIGLARAMQDCSSGSFKLKWYVRKEWIRDKKHQWSSSPTFKVAGDPIEPKRAYVTTEPLDKVLPLKVNLTAHCGRNSSVPIRVSLPNVCEWHVSIVSNTDWLASNPN